MADRQAIGSGATGPVFVNETGGLQAIAGVVFVNETAFPNGGSFDNPKPPIDFGQARNFVCAGLALLAVVTLPDGKSAQASAARKIDSARSWTAPSSPALIDSAKPFAVLGWHNPTKRDSPLARVTIPNLPPNVTPEPDTHDGGWVHDRKGHKKARREQQRLDDEAREDRVALREQVAALVRGVDPAQETPAEMVAAVRHEPAYKALQQQYPLAELRAILANAAIMIAEARQAEAQRLFEQDEEDAIAMLIQ